MIGVGASTLRRHIAPVRQPPRNPDPSGEPHRQATRIGAAWTIYSLNDGNMPQRNRLTIPDVEGASRACCRRESAAYPTARTNPPVSRSKDLAAGLGIRAGLKRMRGTHYRSRSAVLSCHGYATPRHHRADTPGPRSRGPDDAKGGCPVRGRRPCGCGNFVWSAEPRQRLPAWASGTAIGTYLFQTETIRYREISYRKRPYDGHLLPHCCHRAVERIVSVVIRSQRWELRGACAVYRSLPGQKPYADFRHRAGRGCSLGTGLCVRIFGKMGGF